MIGRLVGGDDPEGDVLSAASLNPARGALPNRVCVEHQGDHHRRVKRGPAPTILAVIRYERRKVQLLEGVKHKPRK